jgi:hypothetical protein
MTVSLEQLVKDGVLAPIHRGLAEMIGRLDGNANGEIMLAAALASDQLARGHVCLDLV